MKTTIRTLAMLLAVLSVVVLAAACATQGDGTDTTTPSNTTTPAADTTTAAVTDAGGNIVSGEVDDQGYIKDELPSDLNYQDKTITFLVWDGQSYEEFSSEASGEPVENALYERNLAVETRLGVKLNFVKTKGGSSDVNDFSQKVSADISAGTTREYDMIAAYSRTTAMCAYKGYCQNLLDTRYFDVEKPWWPDTLMNQSAMDDKLYFCSGDISLSLFHNLDIIYVNKAMAENAGTPVDQMYQMVLDGEWTLDKMIELTENSYIDSNQDGVRGSEDTYGFIAANTQSQPLVWGCGITAIDVVDGKMVISDSFTGEKMQGILTKLCGWLHNSEGAYFASSTGVGNEAFADNRCLFFSNIASYTMSKFNIDGLSFGILPPPKYDERQSDYYSVMGNAFSLYAIINNGTDADMCSAVLECMGSEGYRTISPAIFESAMKIKYAFDDTTSKMYDIIRSGVIFDNGRIFSSVFEDKFTKTYNDAIKSNNTGWMSKMAEVIPVIQTKMDEINKVFSEMK